jgi:hypothetical protein
VHPISALRDRVSGRGYGQAGQGASTPQRITGSSSTRRVEGWNTNSQTRNRRRRQSAENRLAPSTKAARFIAGRLLRVDRARAGLSETGHRATGPTTCARGPWRGRNFRSPDSLPAAVLPQRYGRLVGVLGHQIGYRGGGLSLGHDLARGGATAADAR